LGGRGPPHKHLPRPAAGRLTPKAEGALVKRRKGALTVAFAAKLLLQVVEAVGGLVALAAAGPLAAQGLQMLYWLASGQAHTRQDVAQLLGVHRNTVGHWLASYEAGGLAAWLALYVPAGKPRSLPPEVLAAIAQALRHPAGFASYEALRQWVTQTHHLDVNDHTLYTIVRTKLQAKLKVPRPSHTKQLGRYPAVSGDLSRAAAARHPV